MWSPDGQQIAINTWSEDLSSAAIYIVDARTLNVSRVNENDARAAVWSPDSTQIAFHSSFDGDYEIYIINDDGSGLTNLTNNDARDLWPVWSPNGQQITFVSDRGGSSQSYLIQMSDFSVDRLMMRVVSPSWSPDSSRIAFFSSNRSGRESVLSIMDLNSRNLTQLTAEAGLNYSPVWSPDGGSIAYINRTDGDGERLSVIDLESQRFTRLTSVRLATRLVWSPDSSLIAFNDLNGLFVIDPDTSQQLQLDTVPHGNIYWDPGGQRILSLVINGDSLAAPMHIETYDLNIP